MKKILCIISAIFCIFLTACGNESSIRVVGGADGPTSIIVAEKGEKAMSWKIIPIDAARQCRCTDSGLIHSYC